jgi:hypothetical protein
LGAPAALVLCRHAGLRPSHAAVCALLGFYLAHSPVASTISAAVSTLVALVSGR